MSHSEVDATTPLLKTTQADETEVPHGASARQDDDEWGGTEARREMEKALVWKLDKRMSILVLMYIMNFIDRNNAAAARLRGFEEELHLQGTQFASLLSVLYIGYISMQIPSNMFLHHTGRPSLYLPACMAVWGLLTVAMGFTTNFLGAVTSRFLLGVVEASFFPGALFLISKWYKHSELGFRTALLFSGNLISNAFGSLIASAILDSMHGVLGQSAWRWLFHVEGFLTVLVAIWAAVILPDFPETAKPGWLTEKEIRLARTRMQEDSDETRQVQTDEYEPVPKGHVAGFMLAMRDPITYILTILMTSQILGQSFNMYFPTLASTLGYNRTISLLLCAPPFLLSAVSTFLNSRHSDRTGERFYHVSIPFCIGIIGFVIATQTMNTGWRYFSLFLMTQAYAGFAILYGWMSNTFPSPPAKRAVAVAFCNSASQLGNITGSYLWPIEWGPSYRNSFLVCIIATSGSILMCYLLRLRLKTLNKRIIREERERGARAPGFRYLL
ncbi:MFS general substrate transporter [Trametopsis cervina]|nr:MFS general substrate transporter [Trametopsis cervina]